MLIQSKALMPFSDKEKDGLMEVFLPFKKSNDKLPRETPANFASIFR
jgi:hypothetical protein